MSRLSFKLEARASGSRARAGVFRTLHNEVQTPVFMPVGTHATVRGQNLDALETAGFPILVANTYHLLLRPGPDVFRQLGGIQSFMSWGKSILTDSGGFQIFSLPNSRTISEEGAVFRSYIDNSIIHLSPESSIEMQKAMGSDIMMVLDQCLPSTSELGQAKEAMRLTHVWAKRSLAARGDSLQSIFAIVQGACFPELRRESAKVLTQLPFDGFAIGGLAVGETRDQREEMTALAAELLPENLPRYLMGVGTPLDILEAVHRGVDMFDCILPTKLTRKGVAFSSLGRMDLRRGIYKLSEDKLDPSCTCYVCATYSRAYLHHLIRVEECAGWQYLASHNLHFYHQLMKDIRESILQDTFLELYREKRPLLEAVDLENPVTRPKRSRSRKPARHLGCYEIHDGASGASSIRHIPSGEVMHSVNDPGSEAQQLYIEQSRLADRIRVPGKTPLVLWDVGLGGAVNAMAAVCLFEESSERYGAEFLRPLQIVSFENDLDSLRLALRHTNLFPHLRHPAPSTLLREGIWRSKHGQLEWKLIQGDFLEELSRAPVPDLIFFDPFSAKTDSKLWTIESFRKLFLHLGQGATELFTYSNSTAVRSALLAAGFFVARGRGTGPKTETTIALTSRARLTGPARDYLTSEWLGRWNRSHAKFPAALPATEHPEFERTIRSHLQFAADEPSEMPIPRELADNAPRVLPLQ